jgi:hypothetical protein
LKNNVWLIQFTLFAFGEQLMKSTAYPHNAKQAAAQVAKLKAAAAKKAKPKAKPKPKKKA